MATKPKAKVRSVKKDEGGSPTHFTVGIGATANLGNFESARVDLSATFEVPEGANVDELHESACAKVESLFLQQADRFGDAIQELLKPEPSVKKGK